MSNTALFSSKTVCAWRNDNYLCLLATTAFYPRVSRFLKIAGRLLGVLILVIVGGVAFVLAASNIITLNHTATIGAGAVLGVTDIGPSPPTPGCPTTSTSYGPGPASISWNTIPAGATAKHYVCVLNTGTAPDTIAISGGPQAAYGTITSPQSSMTLAPAGTLAIELDWAVPTTAPVGAVPAFQTTIT